MNKEEFDSSLNNREELPAFKRVHTRYRRRPHDSDRVDQDMIDFDRGSDDSGIIWRLPTVKDEHCYNGPMYGLQGFPGFLFAPQALSPQLQERLAHEAVSIYCEAPHRTNIDGISPKPTEIVNNDKETMWNIWKQEELETTDAAAAPPPPPNRHASYYRSFRKLSWSTLGYHYDWTQRCYDPAMYSPTPKELQRLAEVFAYTSHYHDHPQERRPTSSFMYTASACIVNYYNPKSSMGGHKDDLEVALDKALVSISLGRPAVFLLGGNTLEDEPVVPMLVRPGDVMIMGGASRLYYHSMARVLPVQVASATMPIDSSGEEQQRQHQVTLGSVFSQEAALQPIDDSDREALSLFLTNHRININIRQVYPDNKQDMKC